MSCGPSVRGRSGSSVPIPVEPCGIIFVTSPSFQAVGLFHVAIRAKPLADRSPVALRRAAELARSGKHTGWISIKRALQLEGINDAQDLLVEHFTQDYLDKICKRAQHLRGDAWAPWNFK